MMIMIHMPSIQPCPSSVVPVEDLETKATPNQLFVSHPPSALKLMRAGGIFGE